MQSRASTSASSADFVTRWKVKGDKEQNGHYRKYKNLVVGYANINLQTNLENASWDPYASGSMHTEHGELSYNNPE